MIDGFDNRRNTLGLGALWGVATLGEFRDWMFGLLNTTFCHRNSFPETGDNGRNRRADGNGDESKEDGLGGNLDDPG
jgi:hypothetical protein